MTKPFEEELLYAGGLFTNQAIIGSDRDPDTLIDGKNVWCEGPGRLRSWKGIASTGQIGGLTCMLVGKKIGVLDSGSIAFYRGGEIFYIGSGKVYVGGNNITPDASSVLKVVPSGSSAGVTAGLDQPGLTTPPTMIALDGVQKAPDGTTPALVAGRCSGAFSVKVTAIKQVTTGTGIKTVTAESTASPDTGIVTANGNKLKLFFPPPVANQTGWRVYACIRGFASVGPWYLLRNAQIGTNGIVDVTATSLTFDYIDGELVTSQIAPIANDKPFDGTHCFQLGSYIVVGGILGDGGKAGGGGLGPSGAGQPEAFDPEAIVFLNPNEPIVCCRGRSADGIQYIGCRNAIHQIVETGEDTAPIFPRSIFSDVGVANENAMALVHSQLYVYTGKRTFVRTVAGSDVPDTEFALPVANLIETFNPASTVVVYSVDDNAVLISDQNIVLAYKLDTKTWSTKFYIPVSPNGSATTCKIASALSFNGQPWLAVLGAGSSTPSFFIFNHDDKEYPSTGQGLDWFVVPAWRWGGSIGAGWYKTLYSIRAVIETAMAAAAGLTSPGTPQAAKTASVGGGFAPAGAQYYVVTALDSSGNETAPSGELTITVAVADVWTLTFAGVTGATNYRIYRGSTPGGENQFFQQSATTFVDNGSDGAPGTPPTAAAAGGGSVTTEVLINFDYGTVKKSVSNVLAGGAQFINWIKSNVKKAYSYTIRHKGVGANQIVHSTIVHGGVTTMRK